MPSPSANTPPPGALLAKHLGPLPGPPASDEPRPALPADPAAREACRVITFQPREGRLRIPAPYVPGQRLGVCAVGWHWLELCGDPTAAASPGAVTVDNRGRFRLPLAYQRMRFGVEVVVPLLGLAREVQGVSWALVADQAYAHRQLRRQLIRPEWLYVEAGWDSTPWSDLPDSHG